jgi:hypothetical protein
MKEDKIINALKALSPSERAWREAFISDGNYRL